MTEYRIDDLSRAAGTTSRNVRLYHERGLLPAPIRREGRANIYDDTHLGRLRLIDRMLTRGFTIAHIADFITSWETGKDITEVLGLQSAVTAAWGHRDEVLTMSRETFDAMVGDPENGSLAGAEVDRLIELGVVRKGAEADTIEVLQTNLIDVFVQLNKYGVATSTQIDLHARISARLEEIASMMVGTARDIIIGEHGVGWLPESDSEIATLTHTLNHWRELGTQAVRDSLDRAFERALADELGRYLDAAAQARQSQRVES
ncbi:MAG: MerR family transcriptional regulator [Nocardia sp.]|nr:MerR family transcriptional regulator [Nocardia sp.]